MGTTKKPAPRRKVSKARNHAKVGARQQKPRAKKPAVVPPAIISRIEPVSAEEIERRSEQIRAEARQPVVGEHLREDVTGRAGDIALTVLFILFVVFVLAMLARSAV